MTNKINSKSTKAEILEAFEELQQEKADLETQLKKMSKLKQPEPVVKPMPETNNNNNSMIKSSPTLQSNISQVLQNLEKLQVGFGSAVSNLSEQLISEASTLEKLREELEEELQELEDLHEIEAVEENTLDTLIKAYEESSKTFEEELNQQRELLLQEIQDLRTAWKKEQENHHRDIKIRNDEYQKKSRKGRGAILV